MGQHVGEIIRRLGHVALVVRDDLGEGFEVRREEGQLVTQRGVVAHRVAPGAVDDVDDGAAPGDVPQKLVAQPDARVRALEQARDVGKDGRPEIQLAHAQIGHQRRERVIRNLGLGRRQHRQQRRLARVGHADDADVGDDAQLDVDPPLLPGLPELRHGGRVVAVRFEGGVALAAAAAGGEEGALAVRDQFGQRRGAFRRPALPENGPERHLDLHMARVGAVAFGAAARAAGQRAEVDRAAKGRQRRQRLVRHRENVPAVAAVAAGGAACGDVEGREVGKGNRCPFSPALRSLLLPLGTNFSRRNATMPLPPSPPLQ